MLKELPNNTKPKTTNKEKKVAKKLSPTDIKERNGSFRTKMKFR